MDISDLSVGDVEEKIYHQIMRNPPLSYNVPTWQEARKAADTEMGTIRRVLFNDVMLLHTDVLHGTGVAEMTRLPSFLRFVYSSRAYFFGLVRQAIIRRDAIVSIRTRNPLICTEALDEELRALQIALSRWTDDLKMMAGQCKKCPVQVPDSPPPLKRCLSDERKPPPKRHALERAQEYAHYLNTVF